MQKHLATSALPLRRRYDGLTITLHWVTAAIVIFMFASAHIWEVLERGTPLRKGLQSVHISMGILLAAIIIGRLLWRLFTVSTGRSKQEAIVMPTLMKAAAHLTHLALYLLLLAQIVLGFLYRWSQAEPFYFFGLFPIPDVFDFDSVMTRTFGSLHNNVAWALIIVAGVHALAALFHHYVLRDGVLRRMLPGNRDGLKRL
ncbi:cytochrome [Enterobacterales bacterium]|nr:cytochrome [Enterobacterales bacterium]